VTETRAPLLIAIAALVVASVALYQSHIAMESARNGQRAADSADGRTAVIPLAGAQTLGPADAKVVLVEFSDYECPYCIRHFQQTMPRLVQTYIQTRKIGYAFRDWPVDQLHPESIRAHEAAHCAAEQNRFWEMHQKLFGPAGSHSSERLLSLAREVGLDMNAFGSCVESRRSDEAIRATSTMAVELGATGTPTFFVGLRNAGQDSVTVSQGLSGAQPFETFAAAIDAALAKSR